ncbi:MAG: sigma-70 family RNA polymerase sigma factor [Rhodobacteraceae bacterium]|nr:sigma-70 family RNA polymerase sigma factor [Paracoccaceae bacterium]
MESGQNGRQENDAALLSLYAEGDREAARRLTARYAPGILRLASSMLGNSAEAEEVTQETMLRLWKAAPDWRQDKANLSTWLWKVASNLCIDVLRRRRSVSIEEISEPRDETPGAVNRLMRNERAEALHRELAQLPERQRLAVILRHFEGASNPQIAEILGTSTEAVESLLARGIRELKRKLIGRKAALGWQ